MSAFRFMRPSDENCFRILHGSDTDVTWITIVRHSPDHFVVTRTFDNEWAMKLEPKAEVWSAADLKREFDLQHLSPMHYMDKEDYEWLTEKKTHE